MLCYVMCNLFTIGSLQFCNDSTIALLEANENLPNRQFKISEIYNQKPSIGLNTKKITL